jgi:hypothetical protein
VLPRTLSTTVGELLSFNVTNRTRCFNCPHGSEYHVSTNRRWHYTGFGYQPGGSATAPWPRLHAASTAIFDIETCHARTPSPSCRGTVKRSCSSKAASSWHDATKFKLSSDTSAVIINSFLAYLNREIRCRRPLTTIVTASANGEATTQPQGCNAASPSESNLNGSLALGTSRITKTERKMRMARAAAITQLQNGLVRYPPSALLIAHDAMA